MTKIADNITTVLRRIQQASAARQPSVCDPAIPVGLLAVSKTRSAAEIRQAHDAGVSNFGENYLQEAESKIAELSGLPLNWHFIGPIQSNKCRKIAGHFDWVHTLDRAKIAEKLSQCRQEVGSKPLNICIQVNIDGEPTKAGVTIDKVADLAGYCSRLPGLTLRGLMVIPNPNQTTDELQCSLTSIYEAYRSLQQAFPDLPVDTLSMGMSSDLELAIQRGSTLVRVGTDIFGPRSQTSPGQKKPAGDCQ
jgi:pyridoxal phosphate enzyme (YggS family)